MNVFYYALYKALKEMVSLFSLTSSTKKEPAEGSVGALKLKKEGTAFDIK